MPARFNIRKASDINWQQEAEFEQALISIGRHSSNTLQLQDREKVVSRRHAMIRQKGAVYYLVDCKSANATYLNQIKLAAEQPYQLQNGDKIQIGEFLLEYQFRPEAPHRNGRADETAPYLNPFQEDIRQLVHLLQQLAEKFHSEKRELRESEMRGALDDALTRRAVSREEIRAMLAAIFPEAPPAPAQPAPPAERAGPPYNPRKTEEILFNALIELAKEAAKFRRQFMEIATVISDQPLHLSTPEELQAYLYDADITPEEADRRLNYIHQQIEEHLLHERAMLKGYRALVDQGAAHLLNYLNPGNLEKHLGRQRLVLGPLKFPLRWIPFYVKVRAFKSYKQLIRNLADERHIGFDRKIFRPSFIKTYMETVSSQEPEVSDSRLFG